MKPMNCAIIYGSVRSSRKGIRAARFIAAQLTERGHSATLIDPLEWELPLLDRMYKEFSPGEAPEAMERLSQALADADAYVVVSGEYNHSVPPALKNLLDHFQNEYYWKPAGIATYSGGPFGGVRVAVHLRAILGELGMVTLPSMFPVSRIGKSLDEDGTPLDDSYERRVAKFLDELEWYAAALRPAREAGTPY